MKTNSASILVRVVHALLMLPWVIAFGFVGLVRRAITFPRTLAAGTSDVIACPVGHTNHLLGRWTCACGSTYLGHAFAPCHFCHQPAGRISCAVCGLTIASPWRKRDEFAHASVRAGDMRYRRWITPQL